MFARFQKDRIRKARNISSSFSLNEGKGDSLLTHKGKVLGESNLDDADDFSDDSEAGAGKTGSLSKDIVSSLHFGGGFVKKDRVIEPEVFQRDRLTALQEIVMKSKLAKIQKKEFKEDQENERLKLDSAFDSLLSSSTLDITDLERTKNGRFRKDKMAASGSTKDSSYEDSYDQSLIELAFDAKAKPTDRTKSATEIALEEREKLEKLEAARLKRMNGSLDYEDDENLGEGDDHNAGVSSDRNAGKVSKKASFSSNSRSRVRTDDDLDDDPTESGKKTLSTEVKSSSASDDGNGSDDGETNDDEDEDEGSDDGDDDASGEEDEYDEEDDGDDEGSDELEGEEEEDDDDDYEDDVLPGSKNLASLPVTSKSKVTNSSSAVDRGTDSDRVFRAGRSKKVDKMEDEESDKMDSVNPNMPHNIECPSDLESFEHLVEEYVRSPADMRALIDRILIWNSIHLPGKQGADNKNKMHNFMDILLKVFVGEADMLTSCDKTQDLEKQVTNYGLHVSE